LLEEDGVLFRLYSRHATAAQVVIAGGGAEPMERTGEHVWSAHVRGAGPGTRYLFRVHGPWDPAAGHRFDPERLLIDPYARAVERGRTGRWCVVVADGFDWAGDAPPGTPLEELVIYEMHVRGFTNHPSSGVAHPGTFLGIVEKIPYLEELGIGAVELLPVMASYTEKRLRDLGLVNYWGYNPIALFAPDARFAAGPEPGCVVDEFRTMVRELHRAGIEVILDIVFNHTGEQEHTGPTLSLRGIDNATYYRLEEDRELYVNWTGCGNTLDFTEPAVVELAVDCLAYWAGEMHVDGFRFDLAPILGRDEEGRFDPGAPFFEAVAKHAALGGVKLIAEPWDLAPVTPVLTGEFPEGWSDWNGTYRDTLRRFMKGDGAMAGHMARAMSGSSHVYGKRFQSPLSSVNYVTCHDGFTLADLVSYSHKRNEANGEGGRDGEDENHSWNSGAEGPTDDPEILALRQRRVRNLMATLLVSRGIPMILAGDEILRSQGGNNNAYCQDNEISWLDWSLLEDDGSFREFVLGIVELRRAHPALRGTSFEQGLAWRGSLEDTGGGEPDWDDPEARSMAMCLEGFVVILNAHWEPRTFVLPGESWTVVVDTGTAILEADRVVAESRSVVILKSATGRT
jgi:glycogen operon protein